MKRFVYSLVFGVAAVLALPSVAKGEQLFIVAADNSFLGVVNNNQFHRDSICNQFGKYGSEFSSVSIFNKFGNYGGEFSPNGAYNPNARKPPMLVSNGEFLGFITKNRNVPHRVDPDILRVEICEQ